MSDFTNKAIDINNIPDFKSIDLTGIDKKFKNILLIRYSLGLLLSAIVLSLSFYYLYLPVWLQIIVICLGLLIFILIYLEFFKGFAVRKYGIRELDIIFQSGYMVKKETIVPFKRIQHVEIRQDLLMRNFKLYSLLIYTAGESSGDLKIAGLDFNTAQRIKSKVLEKIDYE